MAQKARHHLAPVKGVLAGMEPMDADTAPMLEIKQAADHPDHAWIRVNRMVTLDQAARIFDIIRGEEEK